MPYKLALAIFNSAGERVRSLYSGVAQFEPKELSPSASALAMGQAGSAINFVFEGALQGISNGPQSAVVWDGSNDASQPVDSGIYYATLTVVDNYGSERTYIKALSLLQAAYRLSLVVFNSAGEAVASIPAPYVPGAHLSLPESVKALELDPLTGRIANGFVIDLVDGSGTVVPRTWDGVGADGQPVLAGSYTLELSIEVPGGATHRETRPLTVLKSPSALGLGAVVIAPQPWNRGPLLVHHAPLPSTDVVSARLFNLAGELVRESSTSADRSPLTLTPLGLSGGIYLLELTWLRGPVPMDRKVLKLALAPR